MNIQKPNAPHPAASAKATPQTKASGAAAQGHQKHHFQAYMSADGRPKQAFHPYRDISQPVAPNSALLAKRGIVRPLTMASLPLDPSKKR